MQAHFLLRFESGERQGEDLVLAPPLVSLGRAPENAIQIADGSVSSRHAEFAIDASGVTVRDLGSTNGTRVGGQRIDAAVRLAHGDEGACGNVKLRFVDPVLAEPVKRTAIASRQRSAPVSPGAEIHDVSAERLQRAEKRSLGGLLLLSLLVGVGGAAGFYLTRGDAAGGLSRPIVPLEGNLLSASYSFEARGAAGAESDEAPTAALLGWVSEAAAHASFRLSDAAAYSGAVGLEATLGAGEWAQSRSPEVRVASGTAVEVVARVATRGAARCRIGLALTSAAGSGHPVTIWSEPDADEAFVERALRTAVPAGYDRARVVVHGVVPSDAADGGAVRIDDVGCLPAGNSKPEGTIGSYELFALGDRDELLVLHKISRTLASGLRVVERADGVDSGMSRAGSAAPVDQPGDATREPSEGATDTASGAGGGAEDSGADGSGAEESGAEDSGAHERRARLVVVAREDRFQVAPEGHRDALLELFIEPEVARSLATLGARGYRAQRAGFDEDQVESVLFGVGHDLVRLSFEAPVRVRGRAVDDGFALSAALGASHAQGFALQVSFSAERAAAQTLAVRAREAERDGRLGEATRSWRTIIDAYPFEEELVREAAGARAALVQAVLEELALVREDVDRAGFFGLPERFRSARAAARAIADRYAESEVADEALALVGAIDERLTDLDRSQETLESERLRAIQDVLDAQQMPALGRRVETYRVEQFEDQRSAKAETETEARTGTGAEPEERKL